MTEQTKLVNPDGDVIAVWNRRLSDEELSRLIAAATSEGREVTVKTRPKNEEVRLLLLTIMSRATAVIQYCEELEKVLGRADD